jgi:hypothetical protein
VIVSTLSSLASFKSIDLYKPSLLFLSLSSNDFLNASAFFLALSGAPLGSFLNTLECFL